MTATRTIPIPILPSFSPVQIISQVCVERSETQRPTQGRPLLRFTSFAQSGHVADRRAESEDME
jgi:hypothetical protein